jgi:outer membrane protein assembly factor BamB
VTFEEGNRVLEAVSNSYVFVATGSSEVTACSLDDGHNVWTSAIGPDVPAGFGDGLVFVPHGETLHALDETTGHERWTADTGALAVSPLSRTGWIFVAMKDGSIGALRSSDGSTVWKQSLGKAAIAPMAIDGEQLFVALEDNRVVALGVDARGQVAWTTALDAAAGGLLAHDGRLLFGMDNGGVYSLRQDSGRPGWYHSIVRSKIIGRPAADASYVFLATLDNRLLALHLSHGAIDWSVPLTARAAGDTFVEGREVLVPETSGDIAVYSAKDGKLGAPLSAAAPGEHVRLVAPVLVGGPADALRLLRLTLNANVVETLTAFRREKKPS